MKKLNFLLFLSVIAIGGINAQSSSDKISDDIIYDLEFEFTGEISPSLDSTFIVLCIIDAKKLKKFQKVILKSGANAESVNEQYIDLTDESKVQKKLSKMKIKLGKAGEELSNIEIFLLDESGEKIKINKKNINL
jgi:hypothetical protein